MYRPVSSPSYPPSSQTEVARLKSEVSHLLDTMRRIEAEPKPCAVVVELRDAGMLISFGAGNTVDVKQIDGVCVGDRVLCNRNTLQAVEVVKDAVPTGTIVTVEKISDDKQIVEGTYLTALRSYRCPPTLVGKIKVGDRVVLDPSTTYVIGTLGAPPSMFSRQPAISVGWDDVGGHEDAKRQLREAIELPLTHPELFKAYGKRGIKGILLYGPPGTGKTLLAKAAATSIARAHGKDGTHGFVYVKGPELLNPYIGRSEEAIRGLFAAARDHKERHGYPSLVFLDECDALLGSRDRGVNVSVNATTVPQFLAEMDGMDDAAAIFVLATNRPDTLDSAVMREGRIDRKVKVDRPTRPDAIAIAEIHLGSRPLAGKPTSPVRNAKRTDASARSFALHLIDAMHGRLIDPKAPADRRLRMWDAVSGAMIAELVERASTNAMMRDVEAAQATAQGMTEKDLDAAIDQWCAAMTAMVTP